MSKDTFHVAFDDVSSEEFLNTPDGISLFVLSLRERKYPSDHTVVGVEATGVYHLLLADTLRRLGTSIFVINPLITSRLIKSSLRRVKNDRRDAFVVRKALIAKEGYLFTDTHELQTLKALAQERDSLCRLRTTCKQWRHVRTVRSRAVSNKQTPGFEVIIRAINREMRMRESTMATILPGTQALLRSIPGIGAVTAAMLVAHIGDIKRFDSPEKLVAYIGMDCRVYESGTSVHGKGFLTKRGNKQLRHALFNAAFIARQKNPELKAFFDKKRAEGKHYFSALCAVERKLIHLIYAVWKRGTPFIMRAA